MDADPSLVVAEVVPALSVPGGPVQERAPETQRGVVTHLPRRSRAPSPALSWPMEGFS